MEEQTRFIGEPIVAEFNQPPLFSKTPHGPLFDIYYDRAPKGQRQKEGSWHLYREVLSF